VSDNLYPKMLRWDGYHGSAKKGGVSIALHRPPSLARIGPVWAIDYRPGIHVYRIQVTPREAERDMYPDEMTAAEAFITSATQEADNAYSS